MALHRARDVGQVLDGALEPKSVTLPQAAYPRHGRRPSMSRACVREGDGAASGSAIDRFYQGVLGLSDSAGTLIAKRQQQAWLQASDQVVQAREAARTALGADSFREIFEAAAQRAGDPAQSPTWWATGDAAIAL